MVQNVFFSTSGYGNVAHMYPFSNNDYIHQVVHTIDHLEELNNVRFQGHRALFDAQIEAIDKRGMAVQTTLTGEQFGSSDYRWVLDKFVEHDFRPVFAHKNPNTQRTIHTFMRLPRALSKDVKPDRREWRFSMFEEKNKLNGESHSYGGNDGLITSHTGGCCGWMQVKQLPFDTQKSDKTHLMMMRMMGELMYYSGNRQTCVQLFVDAQELYLMNQVNSYGGYLDYFGFVERLRFKSGIDGRQIVWLVRYLGETRALAKLPVKAKPVSAPTTLEMETVPLAAGNTF